MLSELNISYLVVCLISATMIISMLGLYVRHWKNKLNESSLIEGKKNVPWLPICTCCCFLAFFGLSLLGILEMILGKTSCSIRAELFAFFVIMSRFLLYNVLILRVHLIFEESVYGYSKLFLNSLRVMVLLYSSILLILSPWYARGDQNTFSQCTFSTDISIIAVFAMTDFFSNFLFLGLFLRPLLKVLQGVDTKNLRDVALKCTILTAVSALTDLANTILFSTGLPIYHANRIDDVVICMCLLLMSSSYDNWYACICSGCICCCRSLVNRVFIIFVITNDSIPSEKNLDKSTEIVTSVPQESNFSQY